MPSVEVPDTGLVDLAALDIRGVPLGTTIRTVSGDYYRLAPSTAPCSPVLPLPKPVSATAIGAKRKASATEQKWEVYGQPDVPRTLTVTVDGTGWDGGAILFVGTDADGELLREYVGVPDATVDPEAILTASTRHVFARLIEPPAKARTGSQDTGVSLGVGDTFAPTAPPAVVAVRGQDTLRWLLANDEVLATALPRLQLWDPSTGSVKTGLAATLQDLIDSRDLILRRVIDAIREAGIKTTELDDFYVASQR